MIKAKKEERALTSPAKKRGFKTFKANLPLIILALPAVIYLFVFNYIPLYGLVLPFKDYKASLGFLGSEWCGLENFEFLFNKKIPQMLL